MVRKHGKVRKQTFRQSKQRAREDLRQAQTTRARTSPVRVRAVGDGKLRLVAEISEQVGKALGVTLPTQRAAISDHYFNQHVRSALRRRFARMIQDIVESPDYAGTYKGDDLRRLALVGKAKTGEFIGIGLDLAEDEQGFVYVVSTLRKERRRAITRRVEAIGRVGIAQRLRRVQK